MTEAEAIAIAERAVAAEYGRPVGPVRLARFSTGEEYDDARPPPQWCVYFWDVEEVLKYPPTDLEGWNDMSKTCVLVFVDDATGATRFMSWL